MLPCVAIYIASEKMLNSTETDKSQEFGFAILQRKKA